MYFSLCVGILCLSLFCYVLLCVYSTCAIVLKRKRTLCKYSVALPHGAVGWPGLQCVIVVSPDHTNFYHAQVNVDLT